MVYERFEVTGRTVIVTGSSQGIGRAVVKTMATGGANVVVTSRRQKKIDEVKADINDGGHEGRAIAVECDITDRNAVDALMETTVDEFGSVDILVNNAGASFMADLEEISPNGWQTILDINLTGTYHCTQAAGAVMRENGGGHIINFASVGGVRGSPRLAHYGAAKAGIINFTKTAAYEWAEYDIWVNCVAPGIIATKGLEAQMGIKNAGIDRTSAHRRAGRTEEIADVVVFLASQASSFLTGETIPVKGVPPSEVPQRFDHELTDA
jgi:NAD(P)-dependent dehydrogenase (short-subunit alcohol dehydrogenase family)